MATGDTADMRQRMLSVLPPWFSDDNPILNALLAAAAAVLALAYALYAYAVEQVRIATATGIWLDIIAQDFFGLGMLRALNESDDAYRARILAGLFRPKATRQAIAEAVESLTGKTPAIIEPFSPADCGAYSVGYAGYGVAGAYGSMLTPAQAFLIADRPTAAGVANVGGYRSGPWGYGVGNGAYTSVTSIISDDQICSVVADTKAEGVRIWVSFRGYSVAKYLQDEIGELLFTEQNLILVRE